MTELDDVASDDETTGTVVALELVRERGDIIDGGDGACVVGGGRIDCALSTTELRPLRGESSVVTTGDSERGVSEPVRTAALCDVAVVGVGGSTGFVLGGGGGCDDSVGLPKIGGTACDEIVDDDDKVSCCSFDGVDNSTPLLLLLSLALGVESLLLLDSVSSSASAVAAAAVGGGRTRFELDERESIGEEEVLFVECAAGGVVVDEGAGNAGLSFSMNCCASAAVATWNV